MSSKPPSRSTGPKSKAQIRRELEQAMRHFINSGGEVEQVAPGVSHWQPGDRPPPSQVLFNQPRPERTPLNDVVAALDARRNARGRRSQPRRGRKPPPRQRTIYDDFGEPLRRVWDNDD